MAFAFATLAFLAAAWLAIVVLAAMLEDYGPKVRAALAGRPHAELQAMPALSGRISPRYPTRRPIRLQPRPALRAAA